MLHIYIIHSHNYKKIFGEKFNLNFKLQHLPIPNSIVPCDAKFYKKCPCSHNNNTALVKQIFLFDTALVIKKTLKVSIQNKGN